MQILKTLAWLMLWAPLSLFAQTEVQEFELDNGLKLIVKPDNRAPVVTSQVWYKVGSSYEYNGITGVSHILEHMMFKATDDLESGEFARIIAENGGSHNAFTGRDYTAYFQTMEKDRLPVSFRLEADRMRDLILDEDELEKEKKVVAEERRMRTDDNPQALTREAFYASAFVSSPYHHPIIGWMSDIENYQLDDLKRWYQKWYAPNNATVVVVGDVEPDAVYQLAQKYFGELAPEKVARPKPQIEKPQQGKRYVELNVPARLPYLMMGWKVPVLNTADKPWEPYALEVLAGILDGGESARFARELVRGQQVAAGVGVYNSLYSRMDDVFIAGGTPAQGKTTEALRDAILEQIDRLKNEPVTADELERVKAQVVASTVYEMDSVFYQGMQIGMLETVGLDWQLSEQYADKIAGISAEQVQQVAQKYFVDDRLTLVKLIPENNNGAMPTAPQSSGVSHDR